MLNLVTCDGLMSVTPPLPPVSLAAPPEFDYFYFDLDMNMPFLLLIKMNRGIIEVARSSG